MPTATAVAPAASIAMASAPASIPPIPIDGQGDRRADPANLVEGDGGDRRAGEPAAARAEPRLEGHRVEGARPDGVDQRDGVGAARLGGLCDRRRVGAVGGELHDQRAVRERAQGLAQRRVSAGCSPTISPDLTLGQETLSSIAATSSRAPTRSTKGAKPSRLVAITETTSGTGRRASSGRSSARKPSRPLFGSPIELISPDGVS